MCLLDYNFYFSDFKPHHHHHAMQVMSDSQIYATDDKTILLIIEIAENCIPQQMVPGP